MRTHYNNGDPVLLTYNGCDGCDPVIINGVFYHETGCPEAWRDMVRECLWCGAEFYPSEANERLCSPCCSAAYYGHKCDCPECQYDG